MRRTWVQYTRISGGGLDSITLLYFIRSLGYDIPAISVSGLEDKSIIKIHKEIGVQSLKPKNGSFTRIWVSSIKQKNSRKDRDFTTPDREK